MTRSALLCLLFLSSLQMDAQNFTGHWEGTLTQTGKTTTFSYDIDMVHKGKTITGTSVSQVKGDPVEAAFTIVGSWDGKNFVFQEVKQTQPKNGGWCLKHAQLQLYDDKGYYELKGDWEATACVPGKIYLKNTGIKVTKTREFVDANTPLPEAILGRWTGHLKQSDRGYGFFYEMNLEAAPSGTSYIVSEGNGGNATHDLSWSFDEQKRILKIEEIEVISKTSPKWRWCIKKGTLKLKKDASKYYLEGDWSGYLEDFDSDTSRGKCAPGKIYLEKPILKSKDRSKMQTYQSTVNASTEDEDRAIKIARTIKVTQPDLKLKVWDNGVVDGDIVTLFLNERQLLNNFRLSKTKQTIPITLNKNTNFLILHAENLGDIVPNTVAVSIDDGTKEQIVILSSNLDESGAVMIKQFKVQ